MLQAALLISMEPYWTGDNPEADIRGAKSFGMKAIWKRDEFWEAPEIVAAVVDDLDELPSAIRNLG